MADMAALAGGPPVAPVLAALGALNLVTFALFAADKRAARRAGRRQPEVRLLALCALGGAPAGKLAQRLLRHKTRKHPFARALNATLLWTIVAATAGMALYLRETLT